MLIYQEFLMVNIDKRATFLYNKMSKEMSSFYFRHFHITMRKEIALWT